MKRKAGSIVLVFLFAGVILMSGCIKNEEIKTPANNVPSDTGKGG